ncbi:hypothetical protein D7V94_11595 [Parablautia intestinalis]|uniref:Uncharacterized protein n=1 Tax=Parablautia intestinalis TaxID=2320100 RepID=A0A3A9AXN3_9FIRM|nr:hypothetical protein [Parablautia intestinalis]RKI91135.1 hypothetical protein D7V94_11595 [Parablautia intestinalis]
MMKAKMTRLILDILIVFFLLCFALALRWYINGSFEAVPTEEQQGKAQMGAILSMIMAGIPCIVCTAIRMKKYLKTKVS